jgi:hypothetical protein
MSNNNQNSAPKIPIYTNASVGIPSTTFTPDANTVFVNAYNGQVLSSHPTFATPTGNTSGNTTFHGGVKVDGQNIVSCHRTVPSKK